MRRLTVRNALAIAEALGRTLVLPSARCYCDKIWNNLNACRAPGAETFVLPYDCPMDHIYDLPAWFKSDASGEARRPFRSPGFLNDPRLSQELRDRSATVRVRVGREKYEARARETAAGDSASGVSDPRDHVEKRAAPSTPSFPRVRPIGVQRGHAPCRPMCVFPSYFRPPCEWTGLLRRRRRRRVSKQRGCLA